MEQKGVELFSPEERALPARLSPKALAILEENITKIQEFIQGTLVPDVDFGRVRGIAEPFLFEPGADAIVNAFQLYPIPEILKEVQDPEKKLVSYIIMVKLIHRVTGETQAVGLGTCSTLEKKYGARWVEEPEEYGYAPEGLRTKGKGGVILYQIQNPDWGDLTNTILHMAKKRAEMEATKSLPGVATALRLLFMGQDVPGWKAFWRDMKNAGITPEQVHAALNVVSVKDYVAGGRTLEEARRVIFAKYSKATPAARPGQTAGQPATQPKAAPASEKADINPDTMVHADGTLAKAPTGTKPPPRDPASIKNFGELWGACQTDFSPAIPRSEAIRLLGYKNQEDITEPYGVLYERLWAMRGA